MNSGFTKSIGSSVLLFTGCAFALCLRVEAQQPKPPAPPPPGGPSTINPAPFFGTPDMRQHLNFTNNQLQGMNQAYQNAYSVYQKGVNAIDPNLSALQRQKALQTLQQGFYQNFANGSNKFLTDPAQRQRLDQLSWQYRGFGAFSDPNLVSKLKLTPAQAQKLDEAQLNWMNQMNKLGPTIQTNQDLANQQFKTMQTQRYDQIHSILTPEQRSIWEQMSGKPYTFSPSSYYTPSTPAPGTGK